MILLNAIKTGKLEEVKKLFSNPNIKEQFNIDEEYNFDESNQIDEFTASFSNLTPLLVAIKLGYEDIAVYLIEKGANINCMSQGKLAINYAAEYGRLKVLNTIIHSPDIDIDQVSSDELRNESYWTSLHYASKAGQAKAVELLLNNNANANEGGPELPVQIAVQYGHLSVLEKFIKKGAVDINKSNERDKNKTLMHYASYGSNNFRYMQDTNFNTAKFAYELIISYLIKNGADVTAKDTDGLQPIHYAAQHGSRLMIKLLLNTGKVGINDIAPNYKAPIHFAIKGNNIAIVKYLIALEADVNPFAYNYVGEAELPIHIASYNNNLEIVKALLNTFKISIEERNCFDGMAPLHYGAKGEAIEVINYLVKNGANIKAKDQEGKQPIHYASKTNLYKTNAVEVIKYLINFGANINAKDHQGKQPIHYASEGGNLVVLEYFINVLKLNINERDKDGYTPLHYACSGINSTVDLVKWFIKNNANLTAKSKNGTTPILQAVYNQKNDIVKFLIESVLIDIRSLNHKQFISACFYKDKYDSQYNDESDINRDLITYFMRKGFSFNKVNLKAFSLSHEYDKAFVKSIIHIIQVSKLLISLKFESKEFKEFFTTLNPKYIDITLDRIKVEILNYPFTNEDTFVAYKQKLCEKLKELSSINNTAEKLSLKITQELENISDNLTLIESEIISKLLKSDTPFSYKDITIFLNLAQQNLLEEYNLLQKYLKNYHNNPKVINSVSLLQKTFFSLQSSDVLTFSISDTAQKLHSELGEEIFTSNLLHYFTEQVDLLKYCLFYLAFPEYTHGEGNLVNNTLDGQFDNGSIKGYDIIHNILCTKIHCIDKVTEIPILSKHRKVIISMKYKILNERFAETSDVVNHKQEELNTNSAISSSQINEETNACNTQEPPNKKAKFDTNDNNTFYATAEEKMVAYPEGEPLERTLAGNEWDYASEVYDE